MTLFVFGLDHLPLDLVVDYQNRFGGYVWIEVNHSWGSLIICLQDSNSTMGKSEAKTWAKYVASEKKRKKPRPLLNHLNIAA